MVGDEFEWNQAELGEGISTLNYGVISIVAWGKGRSPALIGSAFVIGAFGETAIALTAAHNFKGIRDIQRPRPQHHRSALPEFLGNMEEIDLDRTLVRAICIDRKGVEIAPILWAAWDNKADIGFFALESQENGKTFFESAFRLNDKPLTVGEEVCVLGHADMAIREQAREAGGRESFTMERRLLLRRGRVTALYPDGHLLCRGPCIETSIPVFAGMSGGPAFRIGSHGESISPFGVISSDLEGDGDAKNNRQIKGASIVALLNAALVQGPQGNTHAVLKLNTAYVQRRKQEA